MHVLSAPRWHFLLVWRLAHLIQLLRPVIFGSWPKQLRHCGHSSQISAKYNAIWGSDALCILFSSLGCPHQRLPQLQTIVKVIVPSQRAPSSFRQSSVPPPGSCAPQPSCISLRSPHLRTNSLRVRSAPSSVKLGS